MKTCFVICPIGAPGSEQRIHSDDLIELVLEPVLSGKFRIVRAHEIAESGSVTEQIITQIRAADLCIVDLSFRRPNVFYEAGRRHEAARPYIHVVREEDAEQIDFDLAQFRYAKFNLSKPREIRACQVEILQYLAQFETNGDFSSNAREPTLSELIRIVRRIETGLRQQSVSSLPTASSDDAQLKLRSPTKLRQELTAAMLQGDEVKAGSIAYKLLPTTDDEMYRVMYYGLSAVQHPELANDGLTLLENADPPQGETILGYVSAFSHLVTASLEGKDKDSSLELVERVCSQIVSWPDIEAREIATAYNQAQRMAYSCGNFDLALSYVKRAIEHHSNPSFFYNLAGIREAQDDIDGAAEAITKCIELGEQAGDSYDEDHLFSAHHIYQLAGQGEDAAEMLVKLKDVNPALAVIAEHSLASIR